MNIDKNWIFIDFYVNPRKCLTNKFYIRNPQSDTGDIFPKYLLTLIYVLDLLYNL